MIMSLYPFFAEYEKILLKIYQYSMNIVRDPIEKPKIEIGRVTEFIPRTMTMAFNQPKIRNPQILKDIKIPIDKIIENLLQQKSD